MAELDKKLNVLLAEDEARLQVVMQLWLTRAGHKIVLTRNGQEALERLTTESFDVLITDVNMPVMNGIELVRRLFANNQSPDLIVILTSRCDVEDLQKEFAAPQVHVFAKPFNPRDLMRLIETGCSSTEVRS